MAVGRDERGRWVKGTSGNPKGTQRKIPDSTFALFANNTDKAIKRLFKLMDDPDPQVRLQATKYFLDKGLGRTFQAFEEADAADGEPLQIMITRAKRGD